MSDDANAMAAREKTLFVQVTSDAHWTEKELTNLVESIDSVTPEDVGVMLATDDIEYLTREGVEQYIETLHEAVQGE